MKSHKNDNNDVKVAVLETIVSNIEKTLVRLESKIDLLDQKIDTKIDSTRTELITLIAEVRKESKTQFYWVMGTIFVLFGSPVIPEIIKLFKGH